MAFDEDPLDGEMLGDGDQEPTPEPTPERTPKNEPEPQDATPEATPEPEVTDPYAESWIAKQYPGGPDAVEAAIKEKDRYIGTLNTRLEQLQNTVSQLASQPRQQQPQAQPEPFDRDKFFEAPDEVLPRWAKQQGFLTKEEAQTLMQQGIAQTREELALERFIERSPDLPQIEDKMVDLLNTKYPYLRKLPQHESLPILYALAKQEANGNGQPSTIVEKATGDKQRANTGGGRPTPRKASLPAGVSPLAYDPEAAAKLSDEELEKALTHPDDQVI